MYILSLSLSLALSVVVILYDFVTIGCHDCVYIMLLRSLYCVCVYNYVIRDRFHLREKKADLRLNLASLCNKVSINLSLSPSSSISQSNTITT